MNHSTRDLLYRSLDDSLSDIEQKQLDESLAESSELRDEYDQLVSIRRLISDNAPTGFEPWFAQRVLHRVSGSTTMADPESALISQLVIMFRRVAIAATVAGILAVSYNLSQSHEVSLAASFGIQEEPTLEAMLDVTLALEAEGSQ